MKVAVFGFGSMGRRHAANARMLGHEVWIFDPLFPHPRPEWTSHRFCASETEALADAEAVVIASPAAKHAEHLLAAALRTNARILVEKPLALSVDDHVVCTSLRDRFTNFVRVGYNLRFHPHVWQLRALCASGRLDVRAASFHVLCDGSTWPGQTYADALLECSHEIDLALWMLGPAQVQAAEQEEHGATWRVLLAHTSGASTVVTLSTAHKGYARGALIVGRHGTASWTWHAPSCASLVRIDSGACERLTVSAEDTYRSELADLLGPAVSGCSREEGVAVLQVCDAARALADRESPQ